MTWFDRLLIGLAPSWGLRRVRARAAVTMLARHYEAAGGGRRTDGWRRKGTDANAAAAESLATLRDLSRDLRRNNGWARKAIRTIAVSTVGWGIGAKPEGVRPRRAGDAGWYWDRWSRRPSCDYDGRLAFAGLQRLVMETVVESGEALVLRVPATASDGLDIPLRVRVLEPDYLDANRHGVVGQEGGPIIQGVEFDRRGRRVAYWLYDHHPGSTGATALLSTRLESVRVPASDVIHVYNIERPGQVRGIPWIAAAIAKLHDFDDYADAILMQQKIAACFAAFVRDHDGAGSVLGEPSPDDEKLETLEPGQIQTLPPGKDITFATPPSTTDHGTFTATNLRQIATSLGITYEDLSGDYTQVNFSSARMGRLAFQAQVHDWRWNMLIPQFCDGVWRWAMELVGALDGWKTVPEVSWAPPPLPMLEPEKEGLAYQRLIRNGLTSLPRAIRELGEDPAVQLAEIAESNKQLDELGIVLDSDPRRTTTVGNAQASGRPAAGAKTEAAPQGENADDDADDGAEDKGEE